MVFPLLLPDKETFHLNKFQQNLQEGRVLLFRKKKEYETALKMMSTFVKFNGRACTEMYCRLQNLLARITSAQIPVQLKRLPQAKMN